MNDHDHLRDLPPEDAEELQAFLEKRKWFERKLSILEAAEPIYPFIHPVLAPAPGGTGFKRVEEATARWHLPELDELKAWQRERDELEQEILTFDGGDLGRMKEKTRAITLIPLTKPSTELVEITLVLILLIDKLLTLLRRRSELLELTHTRLKWDDLRWRVRSESIKLHADVDAFLHERSTWTPAAASKDAMKVEPVSEASGNDAGLHASHGIPKTPVRAKNRHEGLTASPSATTPNHADLIVSFTRSPSLDFALMSPLNRSPAPIATPGPSTVITGFRVRQKQIASLAERSGQLLDRMIDQATTLADLGDTLGPSGPPENGAASGALPEKLLDLQDELEVQVTSLEAMLSLCKTVVKSQEATNAFLRLCEASGADSRRVLEHLRNALKGRPSRDCTDELLSLLGRASKTLPEPIDERSFNAFSHPEYSQLADTGETMLSHMADARQSASDALKDAEEALAYAPKAVEAWSAISVLEADMARSIVDIRALSASLTRAIPSSERPPELRLAEMDLCTEADEVIATAEGQLQRFGVATHRFRHIISAPPRSLALETSDVDGSYGIGDLDAHFKSLQTESLALRTLVESVRTAQVVDPLFRKATQGLDSIDTAVRRLQARLCDEIDAAGLGADSTSETQPDDPVEQYHGLAARFQAEVADSLTALDAASHSSYPVDLDPVSANLQAKANACRARLTAAGSLSSLLDAVKQQAGQVAAAQLEADAILRKIAIMAGAADVEAAAGMLMDEANDWSTGLSTRVRFVSDLRPSLPESSVPQSGDWSQPRIDLDALDRRVRAQVNEMSARVLAAAQSLEHSNDTPAAAMEDDSDPAVAEDTFDGGSSGEESVPPDSPTKVPSRLPAPTRIPSLQRRASRGSTPAASSSRAAHPPKVPSPDMIRDHPDTDGQGRFRTVSDTPIGNRSAIPRASLGKGLHGEQYATVREKGYTRASLSGAMQAVDSATRSHGPNSPAKRRVLKAYVSNEKSELDVAVGSIINTLKVDIPVVPVGMNEADEWTDQSGKYWIGTEGRAKLCFCRILRSKTVMVRVGGGWVELSKFLLDHFADAFWQSATDSMAPATPVRAAAGTTQHSAGASIDLMFPAAGTPRAPSTPASRIPPAIGLGTPRAGSSRIPLPALPPTESGPSMPDTPSHGLTIPRTPGGGGVVQPLGPVRSPSINGVSSPLVPLQFLRKASESPPIREREKEKFASPRRSILGRELAPSSPTKPVIRAP